MEIQDAKSNSDIFYTLNLPKGNNIYIDKVLHANCQIFSIGAMNAVLSGSYTKEEKILILKKAYKYAGKNMVLIDVNRGYEPSVQDLFPKEHIVFKTPYKSTNGSEMTMFLIKTDILKS